MNNVLYSKANIIDEQQFSEYITKHYKIPYSFIHQNGGRSIGSFYTISIPVKNPMDFIDMSFKDGMSLKLWVRFRPEDIIGKFDNWDDIYLDWKKHFYPHIDMICNDLYSKGLIEAGDYVILIRDRV